MAVRRHVDRDATVGAGSAVAVTPSDSVDLERTSRGLYIGGAGSVAVILDLDENPVTFVGVPAGSLLPMRVRRVLVTGTTATSLVALY